MKIENNGGFKLGTESNKPIELTFDSKSDFTAKFDSGTGGGSSHILYASTEYWNSHPDIVGKAGYIYIYSDWMEDPEYGKIAGFKVGDGETLLVELSATDQMWQDHVTDAIRHITQAERDAWNNKVTCDFIAELEQLIFSK